MAPKRGFFFLPSFFFFYRVSSGLGSSCVDLTMTRRIFFANPDVLRTIRTIRPSKFHPLAGPGGRGSGRATRKGAGPRRGWLVKDWDSLRRRFGHDGGESATPVGVGDPSSAKPPALARSSLEHRRRLFFFVIRTRSLALLYPFLSLSLYFSLSVSTHSHHHHHNNNNNNSNNFFLPRSSCAVACSRVDRALWLSSSSSSSSLLLLFVSEWTTSDCDPSTVPAPHRPPQLRKRR